MVILSTYWLLAKTQKFVSKSDTFLIIALSVKFFDFLEQREYNIQYTVETGFSNTGLF